MKQTQSFSFNLFFTFFDFFIPQTCLVRNKKIRLSRVGCHLREAFEVLSLRVFLAKNGIAVFFSVGSYRRKREKTQNYSVLSKTFNRRTYLMALFFSNLGVK
jgi:hypothetical protein